VYKRQQWYHSPDQYALERQNLFGRSWLFASHIDRIPEPSGALAVTVAGWPLLLVRTPAGDITGFHNVCRHRAAPLVWDGQAERCSQLRCKYHGWRYTLDGALSRTPAFGEDLPAEDWGLHPITVQCWRGLIFVRIQTQESSCTETLQEALNGLLEPAAQMRLEEMALYRMARHTLRCDWKTYVENYLEGYHIPLMHPGLSREISIRNYRVDVHGRAALHRVPTREGAISQGLWVWLWPNVALNVYGEGMSLERMNPLASGQMEIEYTYLFHESYPEADRERAIAMSQSVTEEDVQIAEAVQRNLEAGIYETGCLSPRHENGVAAFQRWVRRALEAS